MSISAKARPLDHLVLPTADLGVARERLAALGFTVAPVGIHPFGTENACVYFSDGTFLEPLAIGDAGKVDEAITAQNVFVERDRLFRERNGEEGFSALVFGTEDADADNAVFVRAAVSAGPRLDFSRPFVDASGKAETASFRLAFAAEADMPDTFFFTCELVNAPKVDRSALQAHANGARRIVGVVAVSADPTAYGGFFNVVAGAEAGLASSQSVQFELPNATIALTDSAGLKAAFGVDIPPASSLQLAAIVFSVKDLAKTEALFIADTVDYHRRGSRLIVTPAAGQGAILAFEEFS
ncbi:VOC family protein [Mesorhizobium sp. CGMCC 1.15528]|uniref:VOC family protein n=1 Tax=Mesorhizobium zhangyense TaxID=1776730 RepID=A0A7C9R719_9HYPH|nr:VOC family protein [Mesorhizobium zhangyense]NGN39993.1 VOC family protein [Mesorhizobium zhangyense]